MDIHRNQMGRISPRETIAMIRCLACLSLGSAALLSGCAPGLIDAEVLEAAVMAEGEWGWDRGAGCENQADMVVITADSLFYVQNGEPLFEAR